MPAVSFLLFIFFFLFNLALSSLLETINLLLLFFFPFSGFVAGSRRAGNVLDSMVLIRRFTALLNTPSIALSLHRSLLKRKKQQRSINKVASIECVKCRVMNVDAESMVRLPVRLELIFIYKFVASQLRLWTHVNETKQGIKWSMIYCATLNFAA